MPKTNGKSAQRIAGMKAFDREILIAKRVYKQLTEHLDKVSRRRVIGMVNDYAMQDDADALKLIAPKEEAPQAEEVRDF